MAFKRSPVRSRLSPPKGLKLYYFRPFFFYIFILGDIMKQKVHLFFLLSLILCLSGCSSNAPSVETEQANTAEILYEKYADLLLQLESADYEAAHITVDLLEEQHYNQTLEQGEHTEVVLSPENFSDYFEICEITQWLPRDEDIRSGFVTRICIVLKDEYVSDIVWDRSKASFSWKADCSVKNCDVDYDNRLISIENVFKSASTSFGALEEISGVITMDPFMHTEEAYQGKCVVGKIGEVVLIGEYSFEGQMKPVCYAYDDTRITHAEGILVFYNQVSLTEEIQNENE